MKKILSAILLPALIVSCALAENLLDEFDMVARIKSHPGLYLVQLDGLWGVTDGDGNQIQAPQFEAVGAFEDGVATICKDGKWGLISDAGKILLEPTLRGEPKFTGDVAVAVLEDRSRMVEIISEASEYASLYGLINRAGEIVVPISYDSIQMDDLGETMLVKKDDLYGYMKIDGTWIVEPKYARANPFVDGHAAVCVRNEHVDSEDISERNYYVWGVIDSTGKTLIPFEHYSIESGAGDIVIIADGDFNYGYMNLSGEWIVKPKFAYAELFEDGSAIASVKFGSTEDSGSGESPIYFYGVIGEDGAEILPFEYDSIRRLSDGGLECRRGADFTVFRIENGKAEAE